MTAAKTTTERVAAMRATRDDSGWKIDEPSPIIATEPRIIG